MAAEEARANQWATWARSNVARLSVWACFLTALVVTFSLYPGWLFFDSARQWGWARQIAVNGLPNQLKDYLITSHWPIVNTLLKVPFYWLTSEAGFYILVQAFLFNISVYLVGCAVLGRRSLWLLAFTLVMLLSPISLNYSVFQSSDTIVAACALVAVAMIADDKVAIRRRVMLLAISALLMSLVRYNAIPAAFLLVCVFFWAVRNNLGHRRSWVLLVAALIAMGGGVAGARAYEHTSYIRDSVAEGPLVRLVAASRYTSDPYVHAVVAPLITKNPKLERPLGPECYAHGGWCSQFNGVWRDAPTRKVLYAYFHLMTRHPLVFLRVNYRFSLYALGLSTPLEPAQMENRDVPVPFPAAKMVYNHRRFAFLAALQCALGAFGSLAARAGIILLLGLASGLLLRRRRLVVAFVALTIGYLLPLLVLVDTNNFRYTFPTTIVATAILIGGCCVFARSIFRRVWLRKVSRGAGVP